MSTVYQMNYIVSRYEYACTNAVTTKFGPLKPNLLSTLRTLHRPNLEHVRSGMYPKVREQWYCQVQTTVYIVYLVVALIWRITNTTAKLNVCHLGCKYDFFPNSTQNCQFKSHQLYFWSRSPNIRLANTVQREYLVGLKFGKSFHQNCLAKISLANTFLNGGSD